MGYVLFVSIKEHDATMILVRSNKSLFFKERNKIIIYKLYTYVFIAKLFSSCQLYGFAKYRFLHVLKSIGHFRVACCELDYESEAKCKAFFFFNFLKCLR